MSDYTLNHLLDAIWGDAEGFIEVRSFREDGKKSGALGQSFYSRDFPPVPEDFETLQNKGGGVFFGVLPRAIKSGTADSIRLAPCLWCDVDFDKFDGGKEEAHEVASRLPPHLKPTATVGSGHGYHLYWALREPADLPEEWDQVHEALQRICYALGGDTNTLDAARIFRVPQTLNLKEEPYPLARVLALHPEREFELSDFDVLPLPESEPEEVATPEIETPAGHPEAETVLRQIVAKLGADRIADLVLAHSRPNARGEVWTRCPFPDHEDKNPSLHFNVLTGTGVCFSHPGGQRGLSLYDYVGAVSLKASAQVRTELAVEAGVAATRATALPEIDVETILDARDIKGAASKFAPFPKDLIPTSGFLARWMRWGMGTTDANEEYILWGGVAALAGAIGLSRYFPSWVGGRNLYPNLWVCLVGPSTLSRKSSAAGMARTVMKRPPLNEHPGFSMMTPDRATPEAFLEYLKENPAGLWLLDEMGAFTKAQARSYNAGFREELTAMYEGAPVDRIKKNAKGTGYEMIRLDDTALSILATSTSDWIREREGEIKGGFYQRFMWVVIDGRSREYKKWPGGSDPHGDMAACRRYLWDIRGDGGHSYAMTADLEAREVYENFFDEIANTYMGTEVDSFLARYQTAAIKLAMVLAVSRDPAAYVIDGPAMTDACEMVIHLAQNVREFYRSGLKRQERQTPEEMTGRLEGLLREKGHLSYREIYQEFRTTKAKTEQILEPLILAGLVEVVTVKHSRGRPTISAVWKDSADHARTRSLSTAEVN